MRIIGRVNRLFIFLILSFFILCICPVIKGQVPVDRVTVFIIDTGINKKTEHGSLVAWIINKEVDNSDVMIIPLEVADNQGNIQYGLYLAGLREIIDYKITHPRQRILLNVSLGFEDRTGYKYIKELYDMGVQIIAAAGNNNSSQAVYPAGFSREVIAVANATRPGKADSSNYGYYVDISAPGSLEYIESIYFPGQRLNKKFKFSGTSFSAPRVTALLAVLMSRDNNLDAEEAFTIIKETALEIKGKLYEEGKLGAGIINKEAALRRTVENYRLQKFIRLAAVLILIVLIIIGLWPKYKIFSFFVFLLIIIVAFPFLIIIKENIHYLPHLLTIITVFLLLDRLLIFIIQKLIQKLNNPLLIIKLMSIPSPGLKKQAENRLKELVNEKTAGLLQRELLKKAGNNKKKILIKVLCSLENPSVNWLLSFARRKSYLADFITSEIAGIDNKKLLLEIIPKYLHKNNRTAGEAAAGVLEKLNPDLVLTELISLLKRRNKIDKQIILEVIESYGERAESAAAAVREVLEKDGDMWIRYQAVRTLYNISTDKIKTLSYLYTYRNDEQQLVRMEVRALLSLETNARQVKEGIDKK